MKPNYKKIALFIIIPLAVGGLSAIITSGGMETFENIAKPPLSPPGWLFPIAWSILYVLMGIASYLVYKKGKAAKQPLIFYGIQLFFNFFWSIIFFSFNAYLFALAWLVVLWLLILITTVMFYDVSKYAGYLMIPYLLWVTFAGYLNLGIYMLNK